MRRSCGCRDGEGRRGGGVKAEEKRPALNVLTRGDGEETTLLTGGVGGDHLSVRGSALTSGSAVSAGEGRERERAGGFSFGWAAGLEPGLGWFGLVGPVS